MPLCVQEIRRSAPGMDNLIAIYNDAQVNLFTPLPLKDTILKRKMEELLLEVD